MIAKGTYAVKKWEEAPYEQISPEMKMTKASVEYTMTGEISGRSAMEYLMFYKYFDVKDPHKSSAVYIGLMRFVGTVKGREGSFVIEDHGTFEGGSAKSALEIVADSGTGNLKGIRGSGRYLADQKRNEIELNYDV
ncbi:MAG TPA: DUF3224 domain-containing protein [Bacteroidota bacterium]|nr:DUF3224 domain-containing protein [Bacteroidota bacterium]